MRVDWLYYASGATVPAKTAETAATGFASAGVRYVNTLPGS
jgi:hypothetical protein